MKKLSLILLVSIVLFSCKKETPRTTIKNEYYTIVECDSTHQDSIVPDSIPAEFQELVGIFDGDGVGAAINIYEDIIILFNLTGDKFAWFEDQQVQAVYDLSSNNHVLEGCPFDAVSAGAVIRENRFYIFNEDGDEYVEASFQPEETPESWDDDDFLQFDGTWQIEDWGYGALPFNSVECMWNFSFPNESCFDASEETNNTWIVDGSGDMVGRYYEPSFNFNNEQPIAHWTAENNCNGQDGILPFESIGAACRYVKPNTIQEIFFSLDGTQFTYYNVSEGIFSEVYDLY